VVRPVPEIARDAGVSAALEALAAGDGPRAEAVCRERLGLAPDSVDYLRLLGRALLAQSRLEEAERALRRALELQPNLAQAHEELGGVLVLQRRFEEAVSCLQAALRLDPNLPLAGKKLGQALAALGRGAEADAAFEGWFEKDSGRAAVAIALDHLRGGRKDDAVKVLRSVLRQDPDHIDALHTLAQAHWGEEQRCSDIEAMLRRVTTLAPGHASAWSLLGTLLHETDRPDEAIQCYQRVVEIEPRNAAAWAGLGADYAQVGDMEKSAAAYATSVDFQPGLPGVRMSHAHALKSLGRQAEALREYRAAIALKPEFGEVYWSMANL
jgi:tetratricopeptide (TPR) repeat protein